MQNYIIRDTQVIMNTIKYVHGKVFINTAFYRPEVAHILLPRVVREQLQPCSVVLDTFFTVKLTVITP